MKPKKKNRGHNVSAAAEAELQEIKTAFEDELTKNCDEIPVWECKKGDYYVLWPGIARTKSAFNPEQPYKNCGLGKFIGQTDGGIDEADVGEYTFEIIFIVNLQRTGPLRMAPAYFDDGKMATVLTTTDKLLKLGCQYWKAKRRAGIIKAFPKTLEPDQ